MKRLGVALTAPVASGAALLAVPALAHEVVDSQTGAPVPHTHSAHGHIDPFGVALVFAAIFAICALAVTVRRLLRRSRA